MSSDWRGDNKCDGCGRFRAWDDLREDEFRSIDVDGHLTERWLYLCRECEPGLFRDVVVEELVGSGKDGV